MRPPVLPELGTCTMSSATIPDDMTMSCVSIVERFSGDQGMETEKDLLLRRLKEVIEGESREIREELEQRRRQLEEVETLHRSQTEQLRRNQRREEEELKERQEKERETLAGRHREEEDRVRGEIRKLEEELETILAPSQLLAGLTTVAQV